MRRFFMLGLIVAAGATGPRAEDKPGDWLNPYHLEDTIVVTANRLATPVSQTASSVTIITAEEIARSQAVTAAELLRSVPGLSVVQSGGTGQQTSIFLRGTNSEHVQVLIDGVKINDPSSPSNAINLATFGTDNIDRIEVLRGPQSVLYGSDAMGGVIQIFTRTGLGKPTIGMALEGGSLNSHSEQISLRGGTEDHDFSVSVMRRRTDGISATGGDGTLEKDGFENTAGSVALGLRPSSRLQVRLAGRFSQSDADLDQSFGVMDDPNYTMESKEQFGSIRLEHDISRGHWRQQFGAYVTHYERTTLDRRDADHPDDTSDMHYDGRRAKYDWQLAGALGQMGRMTIGAETESDHLDQELFLGSAWADYTNELERVSARTTAAYVMGELLAGSGGSVTAGGRWDHHETFGNHGTFRLTGLYRPGAGVAIRATYGTGFKAPSLYQVHDSATGNPDLRPERSRGGEIGVELSGGSCILGATYFHTHFDDLIQYRTVDPITYEGMMDNVAEARTRGMESFLGMTWGDTHMRLDYTYVRATDLGADLDLVRRPRQKVSCRVDGKPWRQLSVGAQVTHTGRRDDYGGPTGRVSLVDYTVVNVMASYDIYDRVRLTSRVNNLFEAEYEEVWSFLSMPRTVAVGISADI